MLRQRDRDYDVHDPALRGDAPNPVPWRGKELPDGRREALPVMFTVWHPTTEELAALNAGGHIVLGVLGISHPAVLMQVANNRGVVVEEGVKQ